MALTRPRAAQIYDIDYKQAVRVVTVANVTLAGGAPSQVDGVNLSLKDRVLVTGQSTASQNGIYYVTTLGSGSNGTWSRSLDTDVTGELLSGTIVMVTEGLIYADTQWKITTNDPITVGVTDQTWVQNYSANSIASGNSNVVVLTNANVLLSSAGTANVVDVFGTGIKITGTQSVTGNTTTGNLLTAGQVSATSNITGGNVLTGGLISATSNITGGNILYGSGIVSGTGNIYGANLIVTNIESVAGNITGGNLLTTGQVSATSNVTAGNVLTTGQVSATSTITSAANITGANIFTSGVVSATGNVTGNYFLGNVFYANGITASKVYNGNSEVNVTSSGGNVNVSVGGTTNVALFTTTGEYITGVLSASGNITGSNILTSGLVSATGNATAGNVLTAGLVSATGNATAGNILTAGQLSATGNVYGGNISTSGNVTGNYFLGNVACASGIYATKIFNGISEANIGTANGNANISINGTSNVVVVTETGILVAGNSSASGNVTGGNVLTAGQVSATANVYGGNVLTAGQVSATANVYGGNVLTAGLISAAGTITSAANITGGNLLTGGLLSATGSIYSGNIFTSGGISITGNTITSSGVTLIIDPNGSGAVDGNVVIAGNLSVQGNVTYIDSNVITTNEKSITLGNNQNTGTALDGAGIDIGNNTLAYWRFNNATTSWQSNIGITPAANATLNLGGPTNFWNVIYGTSSTTTGNVTAGNILTTGLVSATGNVTGNYLIGNASQVTGINSFSQIIVTGSGNINASGLTSNVTFEAGSNIQLTSANNVITIAYTSSSGSSIFATGGDMGLISQAVTSSEDLGDVTTLASISYDLGTLFTTSTFNQIDMTGYTSNINTGNLNATGLVSAAGNVTGNYILGNGSQLTGITTSSNNSITITTTNITANFTIASGQNGLSVGPMNTANGVQVTVANGQRWIIL